MDIDFNDLDFLDDGLDDFTLSQVCHTIKKENAALEGLETITLSQTFESYGQFEMDIQNDINLPSEKMEFRNYNLQPENMTEKSVKSQNGNQTRFAAPISDSDIKALTESQESKNTRANAQWAINAWQKWREQRNLTTVPPVPELNEMDASTMDYWLQRFIMEVRNQKGGEYTQKSMYFLMCGILRHLRDKDIYGMNFLDTNDDRFANTRKVLDARMKDLVSRGIGTEVRQADPILPEHEEQLWEKGVLGNQSAESLQYTVFFYACKIFGFRGCDEHKNLTCEQFVTGSDGHGQFVHFIGRRSKTYQGGLRQMNIACKNIKHYCQPGERSLYDIFSLYLSLLGNTGTFNRRPLASRSNDIVYSVQPLGINKLKTMMKSMCEKAGLAGNFTNHSGKRTCATQLYLAGIDEQEIMGRTGHRSEKSVRKYKCSSDEICENVSAVLDPPKPKVLKGENVQSDENLGLSSEVKSEMVSAGDIKSDVTMHRENHLTKSVLGDITQKSVFQNCQITFNSR